MPEYSLTIWFDAEDANDADDIGYDVVTHLNTWNRPDPDFFRLGDFTWQIRLNTKPIEGGRFHR